MTLKISFGFCNLVHTLPCTLCLRLLFFLFVGISKIILILEDTDITDTEEDIVWSGISATGKAW